MIFKELLYYCSWILAVLYLGMVQCLREQNKKCQAWTTCETHLTLQMIQLLITETSSVMVSGEGGGGLSRRIGRKCWGIPNHTRPALKISGNRWYRMMNPNLKFQISNHLQYAQSRWGKRNNSEYIQQPVVLEVLLKLKLWMQKSTDSQKFSQLAV